LNTFISRALQTNYVGIVIRNFRRYVLLFVAKKVPAY